MKVKNIVFHTQKDGIKLKALGDRYFQIQDLLDLAVCTDVGVFRYRIRPGFVTNFRSGAPLVDSFIDQCGDRLHQACWIVHDANYTPCINKCFKHAVDRKTADDLLHAMLLYAGESKFKAGIVWSAVRLFGRSAYEDDDSLTVGNYPLLEINVSLKKGGDHADSY